MYGHYKCPECAIKYFLDTRREHWGWCVPSPGANWTGHWCSSTLVSVLGKGAELDRGGRRMPMGGGLTVAPTVGS